MNHRFARGSAHLGAAPAAAGRRDAVGVGGVGPRADHDGGAVPQQDALLVPAVAPPQQHRACGADVDADEDGAGRHVEGLVAVRAQARRPACVDIRGRTVIRHWNLLYV